ncbi:taperin [Synchiropus splendidus]|uniref:taperin n=1 Tax=Synchiropus splendidus TaxID=270530 RepID=UPI00237DE7A7|nr:taperin [Synchiropus splendidus]
MSGGGDVRVLRQEAGQESPRMPAWKREILERRKAKGGGSGAAAEGTNGTGPLRLNSEQPANVNGAGRNYTITTANQHFAHNKETRPAATERSAPRESDGPESLVLQESLGPLEENPFIKLEKERRKRQDQENAARPVQHILELYGSVPGIRTIRAENIIIIESDPDYFPEGSGVKSGHNWQQNGVSSYSSLNDLLDRRGSAVTEIRAKEVVIYDTTLSKSEENLSTLGLPGNEGSVFETGGAQGRVSRMLQKFDSNYGKLQKKSRSTENLLDLDCSASSRPRLWPKPHQDLVPKQRLVGNRVPSSPVFKRSPSSEPKPKSALPDTSSSSVAVAPRDESDSGKTKPISHTDSEGTRVTLSPQVPCSPESRRSHAEPTPNLSKMSHSSPAFEFRPSPKPDFAQIPDGDVQAKALANLRLQSRNSFTVIPKRRLSSSAGVPAPPSPIKSSPAPRGPERPTPGMPTISPATPGVALPQQERIQQDKKELVRAITPPKSGPIVAPHISAPDPTPSPPPAVTSPPSSPARLRSPLSPPPATRPSPIESPASSPIPSTPPPTDHLPITNIDDIEVESPKRVPVPSPLVQRRKGNTFTVVPKRRGESEALPSSPEPQQEVSSETPSGTPTQQPPYTQLGTLLKKRYPAVEEIEVVGGYLSLAKSCLSKTGSTGKKLNISFNEVSLHSTYEYPSENSTWDSGEEDEDTKPDGKVPDELPSMVGRIHIPRPTFTSSPNSNGNDLSNYVPKHSVDFSAWQDYKHEDSVYQEATAAPEPPVTEEVMLTPADSSSLSDYSSEPALYF